MILRLSLVENKPALLRTYSEDLLVKFEVATTVKTRVPTEYLKHSPISCLFSQHYSSC